MIGDVVNLAARLMQAASNDPSTNSEPALSRSKGPSILCDAATYRAARTRLTFETLPPMTVKGKVEPVAVYRPRGQTIEESLSTSSGQTLFAHHLQATIIGRTAERAILAEQRQALLHGAGGLVVIEGEAGIGKSRPVDDLHQRACELGVISLIGAGDAMEKSTSYHAWCPIFSQLFNLHTPFPQKKVSYPYGIKSAQRNLDSVPRL